MSLFTIAWRSIQQRGVASALTMISMALGVMLVVAVLTVHGVLSRSFESNASLGYNMIVGAKGGQEQLVLNTVYYLSRPVENISYDYYLEFHKRDARALMLKDSLRLRGHKQLFETAELANFATSSGLDALALQAAFASEQQVAARWTDLERNGKYGPQIDLAIPVCLGDYFGKFRVVGTTPQFLDELVFDIERNRKYEFAQGRNFQQRSAENGYFEAVVGAKVAREMDVHLGDKISPAHGDPEGHLHERKFTVVGILKSSGTPNDSAVFVNIEGFYLMEDHAKSVEDTRSEETKAAEKVPLTEEQMKEEFRRRQQQKQLIEREADPDPLPVEQREVTAILLKMDPKQGIFVEGAVNKDKLNGAQAVAPIAVIVGMFEGIVKPIQWTLLILTSIICIVSGISILVSIYNSMSERRHEIAVMRALGAGRGKVMAIILLEATLLSLGGCAIGWALGHFACYWASPTIEERTGVFIGMNLWGDPFFHPLEWLSSDFASRNEQLNQSFKLPVELLIVPALVLLAMLVGLWPALSAYRTDVARSLGK
ncbi:outer membrane-specific lipoprotein transporter subunit LolE [Anatilimnocola aggregata]|uniref:Outer membrane-specific lipoprotein transporter subunit LolE n=1 Tax=Anatilimnocola aggregata TaxID=2528021 RepID=A0A517Y7I1_9BACT|nr:FtsX-like permease family protein [Anatilimnocola aggregata]QDU26167.1 outer membrane-specific lipoprotein transporter subunit LolE [Anatilimnocola aggregata]